MTQAPKLDKWEALVEVAPAEAAQLLGQLRHKLFVPHTGGQEQVMHSEARFRVLRAGRRWGKTELAAHETIMAAISKPNQMVWWVANVDRNVRRGYRKVLSQLPPALLKRDPPSENANSRILSLTNGSQIEFYTAGTPDALAGEGVDFVVIDEAALIPEHIWYQLVRPTLADTGGRALIISTPRGRNWFHKVWHRGQKPGGLYASWHFKSVDNPFIDPAEIEDAAASLPRILFEQEFLAEFVANAASMFDVPDDGVVDLEPPEGWVVLGVDLAKKEDFTVLSACNAETRKPCLLERFNEISWPVQQEYITDAITELQADPAVEGVTVLLDSTGIGDVVFDSLDDAGFDVVPVNFGSGHTKERMVRLLASDLERGAAFITPEERNEFESYEYTITKNGRYQFEATVGHDDMVSAKLLQNWGVVHDGPPGLQVFDPAAKSSERLLDPPEEPEEPEGAVEIVRPDSAASIMSDPAAWD